MIRPSKDKPKENDNSKAGAGRQRSSTRTVASPAAIKSRLTETMAHCKKLLEPAAKKFRTRPKQLTDKWRKSA